MTPKTFPQANFTWKGGGPETYGVEVRDLSVFRRGDLSISCWRLSWRERISSLFFGTVWMRGIGDLPPLGLDATRTLFEEKEPHEQRQNETAGDTFGRRADLKPSIELRGIGLMIATDTESDATRKCVEK